MHVFVRPFAGFLIVFCAASPAAERLTQRCNTNYGLGQVVVDSLLPGRQQILDAVNSGSDPALVARLWGPGSAVRIPSTIEGVFLNFSPAQDTAEIAANLAADTVLRDMGVFRVFANTRSGCFPEGPIPAAVIVTEWHNASLDHYFLSSSEAENQAIDAGAAGPGWARTGETFRTIASSGCYDAPPVFRFYGLGPNSHFFTVDTLECGGLRRNDPGWSFEGEAFGARAPVNGACASGTAPLYRLFNGRWRENDSNHRFVSRLDLYDEMQSRGWIGEGVAMCLVPPEYFLGPH